ncbi:MAG: GNAT family N-acetyltransferase [Dehalococcoidales bacterium]
MKVVVHQYQPEDKIQLTGLMETLQDFLIDIDPLHRLRRLPSYGKVYTKSLLNKVRKAGGIIYLATEGQDIVGCIAGAIEIQREEEVVAEYPSVTGRILELVVKEKYRGQNIGLKLMEKMENYFRINGCDIVRVECFVPNAGAHAFYTKSRYQDRMIDMIKRL